MSEHTRTAQERAEELAKATEKYNSTDGPRVHPRVVSSLERAAFADGFLARDAEPTDITAEQINELRDNFFTLFYLEDHEDVSRSAAAVLRILNIRIEGDST